MLIKRTMADEIKKEYGKNKAVKILTCIIWGILSFMFIFSSLMMLWSEETGTAGVIMLVLWLVFLIPIAEMYFKKLIIENDHVTIKSWIIRKKEENIKYKKINNIQKTSTLWFGGVMIFTGNDKPIKFSNIEDYDKVIDIINEKIDN